MKHWQLKMLSEVRQSINWYNVYDDDDNSTKVNWDLQTMFFVYDPATVPNFKDFITGNDVSLMFVRHALYSLWTYSDRFSLYIDSC